MFVELSDKWRIERFLRCDAFLHVYEVGDLDPFFWPLTCWYGWEEEGQLQAVLLRYEGEDVPVVLALEEQNRAAMTCLLQGVLGQLPARWYSHLSPLLRGTVQGWSQEFRGTHLKMKLVRPECLGAWVDPGMGLIRLTDAHLSDIGRLYQESYPGNWFQPRMLQTGKYWGLIEQGRLIAVAGVHVYSPAYGVASLGNITTHPDWRGKGLGTRVTAWLCRDLMESVPLVGLNVKEDNRAAIRCYEKLGFQVHARYEEVLFAR